MKVLVVEDEDKVLSFVKKGFEERGFCVDEAKDGQDAAFMAETEGYDCIVLDIMLPKVNGYEVVDRIRKKGIKTPVIFLTAKDTVDDRVKGLELGGDDYLVKPFAFSELLARVQALIRRETGKETTRLAALDVVMDISKRTVMRGNRTIELTPREFSLLQFLLEHKGEVVTRTMVAQSVFGYHFDSMSNVIDVHMNSLRKKLEEGSSKPLIQTVRGVGYRIEK